MKDLELKLLLLVLLFIVGQKIYSKIVTSQQNHQNQGLKQYQPTREEKKTKIYAESGKYQFLKEQIENNVVSINMMNSNRNNLLAILIKSRVQSNNIDENSYIDIIKFVLKKGGDVNQKDINGQSPFYFACVRAQLQIIDLLIKNNADVNQITTDSIKIFTKSPLLGVLLYTKKQWFEVSKKLIDNNASLELVR
ncbi:Ankyrin repeat-containing domain [Pseudocohnilembus persalinus]|uniref:Ankyrin repeat-containing domain n=1 Tax=Pseudocohnilembus persalinus TaxID=266149 RepID=A0A0V0QVU3_PSEPJ|nr:Ankyrin repeat-containing domain [Pseudocohnilembus persalinus]|eukprot:KRX06476.1 Ankyrin repeat-containing domain [Pseudocohnilembus persalinus]